MIKKILFLLLIVAIVHSANLRTLGGLSQNDSCEVQFCDACTQWNTTCDFCESEYYVVVDNTTNVTICRPCRDTELNCTSCDILFTTGQFFCYDCDWTLIAINDACVPCQTIISNCQNCSEIIQLPVCLNCEPTY